MGYFGDARLHYDIERRLLVVQASTLSTRRRGEPNAYNVVVVRPPRISLAVREWTGSKFIVRAENRFILEETWKKGGSGRS